MAKSKKTIKGVWRLGEFGIWGEDIPKFVKAAEKLQKLVDAGKNIPANLLIEWYGYWQPYKDLLDRLNNERYSKILETNHSEIEAHINNAYDYFTASKINKNNYDFHVTYKLPFEVNKQVEYSLKELFSRVIKHYYIHKKASDTKDDIIVLFYKQIKSYIALAFDVENREKFPYYKQCVLAAYLTHKVAKMPLSNVPQKLTNPNLFASANNSLKKKKGI